MCTTRTLRGRCFRSAPGEVGLVLRSLYGAHDAAERGRILNRLAELFDLAADEHERRRDVAVVTQDLDERIREQEMAAALHAEAAAFALLADVEMSVLAERAGIAAGADRRDGPTSKPLQAQG
jgi:hypothetical protein